jgi:hypothetical protein
VIEAVVAIGVGIVAGSVSLVAFSADSCIEVICAAGCGQQILLAGEQQGASLRDRER